MVQRGVAYPAICRDFSTSRPSWRRARHPRRHRDPPRRPPAGVVVRAGRCDTTAARSARPCVARPSSPRRSASTTSRSADRASGARTRARAGASPTSPPTSTTSPTTSGWGASPSWACGGRALRDRVRSRAARAGDRHRRGQLALAAVRAARRPMDAGAPAHRPARAGAPPRPGRALRRARHEAARTPPAGARAPGDARRHAGRPPAARRCRDGRHRHRLVPRGGRRRRRRDDRRLRRVLHGVGRSISPTCAARSTSGTASATASCPSSTPARSRPRCRAAARSSTPQDGHFFFRRRVAEVLGALVTRPARRRAACLSRRRRAPPRPRARRAGRSRRRWARFQRWPKGSVSWPWRSPQNASASSWWTAAPACTARAQAASTSSTLSWSTVAVPPMVSGETIPAAGNSLPTCTTAPPKSTSTTITVPPGSGIRLRSCAPNACAYHAAASEASGTTRWTLSCMGGTLRRAGARVLYV